MARSVFLFHLKYAQTAYLLKVFGIYRYKLKIVSKSQDSRNQPRFFFKFFFFICSLVTNSCYKLLENPDVCKDKTARENIFNLVGIMVKRYNHGLGMIYIISISGTM